MKLAIISAGGSQHIVHEGEMIVVDRRSDEVGTTVTFPDVLLLVDGDNLLIGNPTVAHTQVTGEVISQDKGEKIRVAKFRAKSRSRHVRGHRAQLTRIKIQSIHHGNE